MGLLIDFKTRKVIPDQLSPEDRADIKWIPQRCLVCSTYLLFSEERGWYCPQCNGGKVA